MARSKPNILITGTPGTGKTTLSEAVAKQHDFEHVNIGDLAKRHSLHTGWDEEYNCYELDEDRVLDELEPRMGEGGVVIDYHGCDFFPERWFDLVVVLRTETKTLYDRLQARGYGKKKLDGNMESEIMNVLLDEARESYSPDVVMVLESNTVEDIEASLEKIGAWVQARMCTA